MGLVFAAVGGLIDPLDFGRVGCARQAQEGITPISSVSGVLVYDELEASGEHRILTVGRDGNEPPLSKSFKFYSQDARYSWSWLLKPSKSQFCVRSI